MNILQVGTGAIKIPPQTYGGIESHIFYTARHMAKMGHNVTVLDVKASKADPDIEYIDGIRFVRLHIPRGGSTDRRRFITTFIIFINILCCI